MNFFVFSSKNLGLFPVLLFLSCFFTTQLCISQNDIYQGIKKLPISDSLKLFKIDSLLEKNLIDGNFKDRETVAGKYSNWLYGKKLYGKAAIAQQIAIDHNSRGSAKLQKRYFAAGQLTFMDFNYPKSIEYLKQAIQIDDTNEIAGRTYLELGRNYYYLGDYYLSIQYFEVAEKLLWELESYEELTRGYINSVNPYKDLKTKSSLATLYRNLFVGDSIIHANDLSLNKKYNIKRALGKYYAIDKQEIDTIRGLQAFEASFEYASQMKDSLKMASILIDIGILFGDVNYTKSDQYLNEALTICPSKHSNDLAIIYANLGKNAALQGNFETANSHLLEAVYLLIGGKVDFHNLNEKAKQKLLEDHSRDYNFWEVMAYVAEAYLLQFEKEGNSKALANAIFYFKFTDEIFDIYTQNVSEFNSKLQWRKDATKHYGRALKACFYANDKENALYFMEKNKAILLTEAIDKQRTNRSFNLPTNVYKLESKLKSSILNLENQLDANGPNMAISKDLLLKKERLSSYWDSISNLYPNYIPLRNLKILNIQELQSTLDANEIVVSYHLAVDDGAGVYSNVTNGYVLVITKTKNYLEEIPNLPELKNDVKLITDALKTSFSTEKDALNYYSLSNQIYLKLFPSNEIRKELTGRKVSIIADNYLSLLPFEALSTDPSTPTYLIKDSEIHYLYSNSFLENNRKNNVAKNSFLGMAPTNFNQQGLQQLANSPLEIESLEKYYSGSSFFNEMATKESFLAELPNHRIIHLATHADAQDTASPWIAFYKNKITLEELYQTQNNASLVVLSGCNTTLGKQEIGEGVMSLARGFFYSGAQSVMSTLWSIDDRSTATITQEFYKNLEDGQSKSEALRNAKLGYLETHHLSEASPYYWASFIMLGDDSPIDNPTSIWSYWPYLLLGLAILFFMAQRFKQNKNNSKEK